MKQTEKLKVELGERSYPIFIGKRLLRKVKDLVDNFSSYSKIFIITDNKVKISLSNQIDELKHSLKQSTSIIILPDGEKIKSFKYLQFLCEKILEKKIDRKSLLICIGGGVLGDLVGLSANLLLRGIDFIQIPTTLLSQVDSSVGGKTAINSKFGKNLVGTFNQPKAVVISLDTLKTLSKRQIHSGYAEILKYSIIKDKHFFLWLKKNGKKVIELNSKYLTYAIKNSCIIKSKVVSEDEKEKGIREILNFGHTFGHAIESQTGFSNKILHGEAIFIGMYLAIKFSCYLGFCDSKLIKEYKEHMLSLKIPFELNDFGLKLSPKKFIEHMKFDKKINKDKLKFILLKQYGNTYSYMLENEKILIDFLKKTCN